jgi:hypothetical protein
MRRQISVRTCALACAIALGLAGFVPMAVVAQTKVKVNIDTTKSVNRLTSRSLGVGLDGYDGDATSPQVIQLLRVAGVQTMRFPGNPAMSGIYHWSLPGVINPYKDGKAPFFAPTNNFAAMVPFFDKFGSPIVSVDYGSNLDGSGGGEPAEAAAWVAYANGDPASTQVIGKDSKGNDWKTVGYWAGLRAAAPVTPDDGLNALRAGHPQPLNVQLWQIGNEAWNNGYYGADRAAEFDLHAGPIPSEKDGGKHQGNVRVGPATYAAAVSAYAKAMKAVDPKILIGASFTTPTTNVSWLHSASASTDSSELGRDAATAVNWGGDWDNDLLKTACADIDFGSISMLEGPSLPPDYKVVNEPDLLQSVSKDYQSVVTDLLDRFHRYCPNGHTPHLAFTNFGMGAYLTIPRPSVVTLFTADAVATMIESGAVSIDWPSYHNSLFLDQGNKPRPAYYGYQMVHIVAYQPGDEFVQSQSSTSMLAVHATKRRDGSYGLLLVNKDPKQSAEVSVHYSGDTPGAKGMRFDFNDDASKADKGLVRTPLESLGQNFTIVVPAYTATAVLIPKAQ